MLWLFVRPTGDYLIVSILELCTLTYFYGAIVSPSYRLSNDNHNMVLGLDAE